MTAVRITTGEDYPVMFVYTDDPEDLSYVGDELIHELPAELLAAYRAAHSARYQAEKAIWAHLRDTGQDVSGLREW